MVPGILDVIGEGVGCGTTRTATKLVGRYQIEITSEAAGNDFLQEFT